MSRRNLGTLFGAFLLLYVLWLPEGSGYAIRVLVALALAVAAVITGLARIPTKFVIGILQISLVAAAIKIASYPFNFGVADGMQVDLVSLAAAGCLILGIGPLLKRTSRLWLYGVLLGCFWMFFASAAMNGFFPDFSAGLVVAGSLGFATSRFNRWRKKGVSSLVLALEKLHWEAAGMLREFDSPAPFATAMRARLQRWRFQLNMLLPGGPVLTNRTYRRIRRACARYPHTALSWQISYAAALAIEDYQGAMQIVLDAQAHGFSDKLSDRMLAYAMRAAYEPGWKAILANAWSVESARQTSWTKEVFYSLKDDPTQEWRDSDPVFAALQKRLVVMPKPLEPQLVRVSAASAPS